MTDHLTQLGPRKQLSFCECNIIIENVTQKTTQESLIARLDLISKHTQDKRLLAELNSLLSKVKELTPQEFAKLRQDTLQGRVMFPLDHTIGIE